MSSLFGNLEKPSDKLKLGDFKPKAPRKVVEKPKIIVEEKARKVGGEEAECHRNGRPFINDAFKNSKTPPKGSVRWIDGKYIKF
jgi:hypothetical protein